MSRRSVYIAGGVVLAVLVLWYLSQGTVTGKAPAAPYSGTPAPSGGVLGFLAAILPKSFSYDASTDTTTIGKGV